MSYFGGYSTVERCSTVVVMVKILKNTCAESRVQASNRPESKHPAIKSPSIQSLSVQCPSIQSPGIQTTCPESSFFSMPLATFSMSTDKEIAKAFNNYYSNAVKSLNLQCDSEHLIDVSDETDPIERAIKKFKNHPSIINVNQNIPKTTNFEFSQVDIDSIKKMIDNLDSSKSGTFGGIPTNCLKGVSDISAKFLNSVWNNEVLKDLKFASGLKLADIVPVFKNSSKKL